jgi:4-hydroxymandelate oxidase
VTTVAKHPNLKGCDVVREQPTATGNSPIVSLGDLEAAARTILPAAVDDFINGGAGAELTMARNRAAFDALHLVPRVFADVSQVRLGAKLFGVSARLPMAVAPMAYQRLLHPDGELAAGRAAAEAGVPFTVSLLSSSSVEQVAELGGTTWFQLYWLRDRARTSYLLARAEAAGCRAIVLTVDVPRMGRRLRDMRNDSF